MKTLASDENEITLSVENERERPDMKIELPPSSAVTTWGYIRELYHPEDPVAVVLIRKEPSSTIQRVEPAGKVAGQVYQRYVRAQNAQGFSRLPAQACRLASCCWLSFQPSRAMRHFHPRSCKRRLST